jgi:two-component system chemotaxis response regulator CheB
MPTSAIRLVETDHVVTLDEMGALLARLAGQPVDVRSAPQPPARLGLEARLPAMDENVRDLQALGRPSTYTCPHCSGTLWQMDGEVLRFRCHTGHAFTAGTLVADQRIATEDALYVALRVLHERIALLRQMAERYHDPMPATASQYETKASDLQASVEVIERLIHAQWSAEPREPASAG